MSLGASIRGNTKSKFQHQTKLKLYQLYFTGQLYYLTYSCLRSNEQHLKLRPFVCMKFIGTGGTRFGAGVGTPAHPHETFPPLGNPKLISAHVSYSCDSRKPFLYPTSCEGGPVPYPDRRVGLLLKEKRRKL